MAKPKIVLMACGSFSPPTPMHFRMFEIAKDFFNIQESHDVVGGIVSPTHDSYGKKGLVSSSHRVNMLKLGLRSSNWIRISEWEVQQEKWSRTKQVLEYHQNFLNNFVNSRNNNIDFDDNGPEWFPETSLLKNELIKVKLLCGADLLESFAVPGLWQDEDIEDILVNHGIIVITRSGSNPEKFIFESDILSKYRRHITLVTNFIPNEISSTKIRTMFRRGESVKYLLDDSVIQYIEKWRLYRNTTSTSTESMDESDNSISQPTPSPLVRVNLVKDTFVSVVSRTNANVFCCGPTDDQAKKKSPGRAVKLSVNDADNISTKKFKSNV